MQIARLLESQDIRCYGNLEIAGDIPANVRIQVIDGDLTINGNVGDNAQISLTQSTQDRGGFFISKIKPKLAYALPPKLQIYGNLGLKPQFDQINAI